jgi:hypothetical protein
MTKRRLYLRETEDGRQILARQVSEPDNIGDCFCGKPVYAVPGQRIIWLTRTVHSRVSGEDVEVKKFPTHKACRKKRDNI